MVARAIALFGLVVAVGGAGGCGPVAREVNIPIPVSCVLGIPADPALPVAGVTATTPDEDVVRAMAATIEILKDRVKEDDRILAACVAVGPQADLKMPK